MDPNDLLEIKLDNVASIINFVASNEMCYPKKPIHNHHCCNLSPLSSREGYNKIHAHIILWLQRCGSGMHKP